MLCKVAIITYKTEVINILKNIASHLFLFVLNMYISPPIKLTVINTKNILLSKCLTHSPPINPSSQNREAQIIRINITKKFVVTIFIVILNLLSVSVKYFITVSRQAFVTEFKDTLFKIYSKDQ